MPARLGRYAVLLNLASQIMPTSAGRHLQSIPKGVPGRSFPWLCARQSSRIHVSLDAANHHTHIDCGCMPLRHAPTPNSIIGLHWRI